MLYHLVITAIAITALLGLWIGVQSLVRIRSGAPRDTDVLACVLCSASGLCGCGLRKPHPGHEHESSDHPEEVQS